MVLPLIAAGIGLGLLGAAISSASATENSDMRTARNMYRDMANGRGPSFATKLIQNQMSAVEQQNMALAQSVNPSNPNAGIRTAMNSSDSTRRNLIGQAGAIRAQEQQMAVQGLAQAGAAKQAIDQQRGAAWGGFLSGVGGSLTTMGMAAPAAGAAGATSQYLGAAANQAPGQGMGSNVGLGAGMYYAQNAPQPQAPMAGGYSGGNGGGAFVGGSAPMAPQVAYSAPQTVPYQPQSMNSPNLNPNSFYARGFSR